MLDQVKRLLSKTAEARAAALLEALPALLEPGVLRGVLSELTRLLSVSQGAALGLLVSDPSLALSCQGLVSQERGHREDGYFPEDGAMPGE